MEAIWAEDHAAAKMMKFIMVCETYLFLSYCSSADIRG